VVRGTRQHGLLLIVQAFKKSSPLKEKVRQQELLAESAVKLACAPHYPPNPRQGVQYPWVLVRARMRKRRGVCSHGPFCATTQTRGRYERHLRQLKKSDVEDQRNLRITCDPARTRTQSCATLLARAHIVCAPARTRTCRAR
jgi:hypothetical protein